MAEKFSIDDILNEYNGKDSDDFEETSNHVKKDLKLSDDINGDIFSSEYVERKEKSSVIEDDESDYDPVRAKDFDDEMAQQEALAAEKKRRAKKAQENAAMISGMVKQKRGTKKKPRRSTNASPVNRANIKDVHMGLTGKIIPKTEEFDRAEIPDDASFEEKSEMISERRKKKVDNFVLDTDISELNELEDDFEDEVEEVVGNEFEKFSDAPKILSDILQVKNNLFVRLCVLLCTGIFSVLITVANDFGMPLIKTFDRSITPGAYLFTNTILGLISIAVSYTVLASGIKNIFKRKADCDSMAAIPIFVTVVSGIINLFNPESIREEFYHVYISAAIVGLIFNTIGKMMIVKRTEQNFRYVSEEYDRYALSMVNDEDIAAKFTKGALNDFPELATMRKTEFVEDFMKNSYSSDASDEFAKKVSPLVLIAGLVIGLISFFLDKNAASIAEKAYVAMATFSGVVTMCSSVALMLVVNVPMGRASKKYLSYSAVMLGYSAVEEYADTNSVLVEAEQLFPNGMVDLVNLKLTSTTSVEECILMAASLSCHAGSVLKPTFYKMLRGKTEMLYPVESYIYEDGLGLSGWIENKRILLGNRQLMENHSIEGLPTEAKEKEYAKDNMIVYLSISGVVTALFVVRVNSSISVSRWMQELEGEGITTVIRTVDSFLSIELLSKLFDVMPTSIKLLPFRYHKDYEKETGYVPRMSSSMLCSGHFPSFAMLLCGAKRLKFVSNLGIAVQFGAIVLGVLLCLIMLVTGAFAKITPTVVLCYNLIFVAVTLLIQQIKKL
ncbi:MAG: hypothetical protein ACI4I6_01825 [Hominimerdicola sp.]